MSEITRYQIGHTVELNRSTIHEAAYNPRRIENEAQKTLKRGIRTIGLTGGIVVNSRTGNTLVSGHQRIAALDDLEHYNASTFENDYKIRVDLIDVDEKKEKELVILLNNPNAQGEWDYEKLRVLVPDIDYKAAGLTDADLSMIGVDYLFKTENENRISSEFDEMMEGVNARHKADLLKRRADREELRSYDDKKAHMQDIKQQVREKAIHDANNLDAYIVLSFDNNEALCEFLSFFGLPAGCKYIKGETIMARIDYGGIED